MTICCSHTMLRNGSPLKATNIVPIGGLFGSLQRPDDNVGASDTNAGHSLCKDTQFEEHPNSFPPPPVHSYSPLHPPFPDPPLFYNPAPINMIPISQPNCGATKEYPCYGPRWQGYDFPQEGNIDPQMFPSQQFTAQQPSSPGASRVPLAQPRIITVIWPTSSSTTAYG
jgi:hypothetical protein